MIHLGQAATTCPKPVEATEADSREPSSVAIGLGSCVCRVPRRSIPHPCPLGSAARLLCFEVADPGLQTAQDRSTQPPTKWERHHVG